MLVTWKELINDELFQSIIITLIKVFVGLVIVYVLFKFINIICKKIELKMNKSDKFDLTVSSFVKPLISKILKFFVIIGYIGFIGIETSSIAAAITSAGLAIGLAMQGSLANFAGGFIILIMRPFKVGDYINTCGESGTVESIQIFYTTLITPDNRVIRIPNGEVANSSIIDESEKNIRRVDLVFSIAHKNDFNKVKKLIEECIKNSNMELYSPQAPFIKITTHGASSIDISVRVWVDTKNYWDMYFYMLESVKVVLNSNDIDISYSKIDVKLIKD